MRKKVLSFFLCTLLFINLVPTFAIEQSSLDAITEEATELFVTTMESASYFTNADDYYYGESDDVLFSAVQLCLESTTHAVFMQLDLQETTLAFSGRLSVSDDAGYYNDKLVLGDFDGDNEYNVALFKAIFFGEDDSRSTLIILLERVNTGELLEMCFNLTQDMFDLMCAAAIQHSTVNPNQIQSSADFDSADEAKREFLQLYIPEKNFLAENNVSTTSALASEDYRNTSSNSGVGITHTTLKNFIKNVEEDEVVTVSNSVVRSLLCQEDWSFYKTSSHFYVSYGIAVSDTEYAMAILLASLSDDPDDGGAELSASCYVTKCITLTYDSVLQEASLMFLDSGLRLEDMVVALELVGGSTCFRSATMTYTYVSGSSGFDLLCAIDSNLGTASQIWNALFQVDTDSGDTKNFGEPSVHDDRYGGLVRAVANRAGSSSYLDEPETEIGIIGCYDAEYGSYSSYRFSYCFTAVSLI